MGECNKTREQLSSEAARSRRRIADLQRDKCGHQREEEVLRERGNLCHLLVSTLDDGFFVTNGEGVLTFANGALARIHGFDTPEELVGYQILDLVAPSAREGVARLFSQAVSGGRAPASIEIPLLRISGEIVQTEVKPTLIFHKDGTLITCGPVLDITRRKSGERALRVSEEKYRSIFENAPVGIFRSSLTGKFITANREMASIFGYSSPEELVAVVNRGSISDILYADPEARPRLVRRASEDTGEWFEYEGRFRRKDGRLITLSLFFRNIPDESRASDTFEGFAEDITARVRTEGLLRFQRDLALSLGSTSSTTEALDHLLKATVKIDGIDSGGVYLVDGSSGELRLATHIGLSPSFIEKVSRYGAETPQARFAMMGEPIYWPNARGVLNVGKLLKREGLTSLAAVPVKSKGQVVAVLNLASHEHHEISESTIGALEAIAAQIGGIISRVRTEDELQRARENLAEANTALKVLLKRKEDDRREMEEALLANVRNRVTPYIEKLMESRLSADQSLFLERVQSHLQEITSPFLQRLSSQFAKLTPMETRVADLIRGGKTSKEVALILRSSERCVLFHRQNIRNKLGLKSSKANLRSFLYSLA